MAVRDYITLHPLGQGMYKGLWDQIGVDPKAADASSTFQLPFKTMEAAVVGVAKFFGMSVCEGSDRVNITEKVH